MIKPPMTSILEQTRNEGRDEAREHYNHIIAQTRMCEHDEAYNKGRRDGRSEAPSRILWFFLGMLSAILVYLFLFITF